MREKQFQSRMDKLHTNVQRRLSERLQQDELKAQRMLAAYEEEDANFAKSLDKIVDEKDFTDARQRKLMYHDW